MGFEIDGLEEFKKEMLEMANEKFPEEKEKEMKKLGLMAVGQIKPLIPVDTGRLRSSVFSHAVDSDTTDIIAPTDYAEWVNNGFTIKPRFISKEMLEKSGGKNWGKYNVNTSIESKVGPTSYIQETVKLPITNKNVKGFMTHYQFILGKHFMEKGIQNAEPLIIAEIDRWLNELLGKV